MDWPTIALAVYVVTVAGLAFAAAFVAGLDGESWNLDRAASLAVKAIVVPLIAVVALGHTFGEAVRKRRPH